MDKAEAPKGAWTVFAGQELVGRFDTEEEAETLAVSLPQASVWEGRFRRGVYKNGTKVKEQ